MDIFKRTRKSALRYFAPYIFTGLGLGLTLGSLQRFEWVSLPDAWVPLIQTLMVAGYTVWGVWDIRKMCGGTNLE